MNSMRIALIGIMCCISATMSCTTTKDRETQNDIKVKVKRVIEFSTITYGLNNLDEYYDRIIEIRFSQLDSSERAKLKRIIHKHIKGAKIVAVIAYTLENDYKKDVEPRTLVEKS